MVVVLCAICGLMPINTFSTFLPVIVQDMGYHDIRATLMGVPPFIVGAIGLYIIVYFSDRFWESFLHLLAALTLAFLVVVLITSMHGNRLRYGVFDVCLARAFVTIPSNYA